MSAELVIAFAIPVFVALMALELVWAWWRGQRVARFADVFADLSCGLGQQATGLLFKAVLLAGYTGVWHLAAIGHWPMDSWLAWVAALLVYDHQYYWWHRVSHRSNLVWATHVVHHQSEDYNLAVALRQAWFSSLSSFFFYLPLAVLGVPPVMFITVALIDLLYQFWIHTELIGKLGPLEWVLNTPSHHRVHHGVDPRYVDKNYAGIFIVWDRLYGTFTEEEHRPTYGTVKPLKSWNPVWANLEPWQRMAATARQIPGWRDRVRYVLGPPEWLPDALGGPIEVPEPEPGRITWDVSSTPAVHAYVAVLLLTALGSLAALLVFASELPMLVVAGGVGLVLWTTVNGSALLESARWALPSEWARLGVSMVGVAMLPVDPVWQVAAVSAFAVCGVAVWRAVLAGAERAVPVLAAESAEAAQALDGGAQASR